MARYFCGDCEKSYARMARFEEHFELEMVTEKDTRGGKLIQNPCYKRKRKIYGMSLEEARSNKRQKTIFTCIKKVVGEEQVEVEKKQAHKANSRVLHFAVTHTTTYIHEMK